MAAAPPPPRPPPGQRPRGNRRGARGTGCVAGRVLRSLLTDLRSSWRALPQPARSRWIRSILVAYARLFVVVAAAVWAGRRLAPAGLAAWDRRLLQSVVESAPISFSSGIWLQTLGTDLMLWLVAIGAAAVAVRVHRPLTALSILAAGFLLDPAVRFGWMLWPRPRPQLVADGTAAPGFAAFPSGHAAEALALYGLLAYLWARASRRTAERAAAALLAGTVWILIAFGRLRVGAHWPSDVVAGAIVGAAWLAGIVGALRAAERTAARPSGAERPAR